MEKDILFRVIFAIIFAGNLALAVWNCMKGDFLETGISAAIVVLIIVCFFAARKKT